jgi:hypothetical protein
MWPPGKKREEWHHSEARLNQAWKKREESHHCEGRLNQAWKM